MLSQLINEIIDFSTFVYACTRATARCIFSINRVGSPQMLQRRRITLNFIQQVSLGPWSIKLRLSLIFNTKFRLKIELIRVRCNRRLVVGRPKQPDKLKLIVSPSEVWMEKY